MRSMSMRFENSAMQTVRIDSLQLNDLGGAGEAADDSNRGRGNTGKSGEEADNRLVSLAIHRRRGDVQLPVISIPACEFGLARVGADPKRESGFHSSRFPARRFCATRFARAGRSLRPPGAA